MIGGDQSAETTVRVAAERGEVASLRGASVSGELLRELLTGEGRGRVRAVALHRARIVDVLDLSGSALGCPLQLFDCTLEEPLRLVDCTSFRINLRGGRMPGVFANGLRTRGDLTIGHGLTVDDGIALNRARVDGMLDLSHATVGATSGLSLQAMDCTVGANFRAAGLSADGTLELVGAEISGHAHFQSARLRDARHAISLQRAVLGGSVFMTTDFFAQGNIDLGFANVGGSFYLRDAFVSRSQPTHDAQRGSVSVDGASFGGDFWCQRSTVEGTVSMIGARVEGDLVIPKSTIGVRDGLLRDEDAFRADRAQINGDVFITEDSSMRGPVSLSGLTVAGQIIIDEVSLWAPKAVALDAQRMSVSGSITCKNLVADGTLSFQGANVQGQLGMSHVRVNGGGGRAFDGEALKVGSSLIIQHKCIMDGGVSLVSAEIGSVAEFFGVELLNPNGVALQMATARVERSLVLLPSKVQGAVDLSRCTAGDLIDSPAAWPERLRLSGFEYQTIESSTTTVEQRLGWLMRAEGHYTPQPYEQLISAYRRSGRVEDARAVAIAKRRRRRTELSVPSRTWDFLLDLSISYGYRTWRAFVGLALLAFVGSIVFSTGYPEQFTAAKPKETLPSFHAVTYALDVLVPVVNLRQRDAWTPSGAMLVWSVGLTFAGWLLTTAVIAAVTGLLRRE